MTDPIRQERQRFRCPYCNEPFMSLQAYNHHVNHRRAGLAEANSGLIGRLVRTPAKTFGIVDKVNPCSGTVWGMTAVVRTNYSKDYGGRELRIFASPYILDNAKPVEPEKARAEFVAEAVRQMEWAMDFEQVQQRFARVQDRMYDGEPDCGVEPVVEKWDEFVCPLCGQVFDSEQRCQKHAASCQAGWLMELASYLGCTVRHCGQWYRFFGMVVDTMDYEEKVTVDGVYIYYGNGKEGLTLEPKVLNIPMGSVEIVSHEAAVKEAVALAEKIAGDVFDRMLKEASQ